MSGSDDDYDLYGSVDLDDNILGYFETPKSKEEPKPADSKASSETATPKKSSEDQRDEKSFSRNQSIRSPETLSRNDQNAADDDNSNTPRDTTPHGKHDTSIQLDKLPWWTTDVQLEGILTDLGFNWTEMRFTDTKNGKLGTVIITFGDSSTAQSARNELNGKIINGSSCEASSYTQSSGRFAPQRQSSSRREERGHQNSPYQRSSDRRGGDSNRNYSGRNNNSTGRSGRDNSEDHSSSRTSRESKGDQDSNRYDPRDAEMPSRYGSSKNKSYNKDDRYKKSDQGGRYSQERDQRPRGDSSSRRAGDDYNRSRDERRGNSRHSSSSSRRHK